MNPATLASLVGLPCFVSRPGFVGAYGTLQKLAPAVYHVTSPGGSHSYTFTHEDVASIGRGRVVTLNETP